MADEQSPAAIEEMCSRVARRFSAALEGRPLTVQVTELVAMVSDLLEMLGLLAGAMRDAKILSPLSQIHGGTGEDQTRRPHLEVINGGGATSAFEGSDGRPVSLGSADSGEVQS